MQENNDKNQGKNGLSFESLDILIAKWKDGTFSEIIDDWKWIFSYSVRYKWAIVFYTILGIFSTSMGLVSSVAGKYLIDIITGYKTNKLMILIIVMVGSSLFSLLFSSIISRISAKLSIYINNDIQADIFDKIVDADWLEINKYSNGDVLNRFNGDIGTVSSNAISWLPTIVIAIYNFIATFLVILHYNAVMAILALATENTPEGESVPGQMACRAGKSSFVVNWQGEMRSCVVLDKPSIPLRDVEFEEAWEFTKKETESLRISARCSSCKLRKVCNTCVAAAIAETGKADGVPEYLCRYTEATVRYLKETSKK